MTTTTKPAAIDNEPGGLKERRQFLELLALRDDAIPALADDADSTEMEMVRLALQYIALELIKVSAEHEIETGDALQAQKYMFGIVAGLIGVPSGTDDHPFPESFDIGARERARFLSDSAAVGEAQARLDHSPARPLAVGVDQAAELVGCSPFSIRRLVAAGRLPTVADVGRRVLIPVIALERFVNERVSS